LKGLEGACHRARQAFDPPRRKDNFGGFNVAHEPQAGQATTPALFSIEERGRDLRTEHPKLSHELSLALVQKFTLENVSGCSLVTAAIVRPGFAKQSALGHWPNPLLKNMLQ
jgi:hypothetical protein